MEGCSYMHMSNQSHYIDDNCTKGCKKIVQSYKEQSRNIKTYSIELYIHICMCMYISLVYIYTMSA